MPASHYIICREFQQIIHEWALSAGLSQIPRGEYILDNRDSFRFCNTPVVYGITPSDRLAKWWHYKPAFGLKFQYHESWTNITLVDVEGIAPTDTVTASRGFMGIYYTTYQDPAIWVYVDRKSAIHRYLIDPRSLDDITDVVSSNLNEYAVSKGWSETVARTTSHDPKIQPGDHEFANNHN